MLIAIPSKGRAGKTSSDKLLPSCVLFVPESEADGYRKNVTTEVREVPNAIRGITKTRNWILDNADDEQVVFVDDDVKAAGWILLQEEHSKHQTLTEQQWLREFENLFAVCSGVGFPVWGVATHSAPRGWYPWRPFIWRSYVTASCMGMVNDGGIRFDESYPVKEDYELCLRCIKQFGGVVAARYLYWENAHWVGEGGCKDYRTQSMERECIRKLIHAYPGMIRSVTRGGE